MRAPLLLLPRCHSYSYTSNDYNNSSSSTAYGNWIDEESNNKKFDDDDDDDGGLNVYSEYAESYDRIRPNRPTAL
jgi:hypothetical protein